MNELTNITNYPGPLRNHLMEMPTKLLSAAFILPNQGPDIEYSQCTINDVNAKYQELLFQVRTKVTSPTFNVFSRTQCKSIGKYPPFVSKCCPGYPDHLTACEAQPQLPCA